jgi:hypothetical protein
MFRKLLLGTVASLGLLAPLAVASNAEAHDFRPVHRYEHACRVYYRDPCRPVWVFAGRFRHHREAVRFAETFRCRGFEVVIR